MRGRRVGAWGSCLSPVLVCAAALSCAPAPAAASVAKASAGRFTEVSFRDRTHTPNSLTIRSSGRRFLTFEDGTAPIRVNRGCRSTTKVPPGAKCTFRRKHRPPPTLLQLEVSTGKGADRVLSSHDLDSSVARRSLNSIYTGAGPDVIEGSRGFDVLAPGPARDIARGGRGKDLLAAEDVADGGDRLLGGRGEDVVDYGEREGPLTLDLRRTSPPSSGARGEHDLLRGIEDAIGGIDGDRLIGNSARNALFGGEGGDLLVGGPGRDRLFGDQGRDRFDAGAGRDHVEECCDKARDIVDCGPGRDTATVGKRDVVRNCERVRRIRGPIPFRYRERPPTVDGLPSPLRHELRVVDERR